MFKRDSSASYLPLGGCRPARRWVAIALAASVVAASGCSTTEYVKLRSVPKSPLSERLKLSSRKGPQPSDRAKQALRQLDLLAEWDRDPQTTVDRLQAAVDRDPTSDRLYALAELNFLAAKRVESKDEALALDRYGAAVASAYRYLFDDQFGELRNPYDPQFRGACDLYNGSLENALRIVNRQGGLAPGRTHTIESATQRWDITVAVKEGAWSTEDFDRFEFVSDYEVQGLANQFQTFGLGVPLIAVRKGAPKTSRDQFFPPEFSFPVTAFLRVLPDHGVQQTTAVEGAAATSSHQCMLELYDPLSATDVMIAGRRVPLESDLSTPLAYFLNDPRLNQLATAGLLRPGASSMNAGIYMLEPYQAGKIPVLMVHGLWSSPITWMEMFNDLRAKPEIREHYQFWFYLYPTGQPFWTSAAQMRSDLAHMRTALDPERREAALDQMVLVGHSMGGLVSKLQTVSSGDEFWRIVSDRPIDELSLSAESRERIRETFYFEANPSVKRVVTIGTPHRGSKFANDTARWLAQKVITLPERSIQTRMELAMRNPGAVKNASLLFVQTSLDSLAPDSPALPVLLEIEKPTWIRYHNIIGRLPDEGFVGRLAGGTDGVVSYESASVPDVESELVVNADHLAVHRHPLAVLEVERILLEHLDALRYYPHAPPPRVRTVDAHGAARWESPHNARIQGVTALH